jgi:sensor histidine kinase YesM
MAFRWIALKNLQNEGIVLSLSAVMHSGQREKPVECLLLSSKSKRQRHNISNFDRPKMKTGLNKWRFAGARFWLLVSGFWIFIATSTYVQDLAATLSKGAKNDAGFTLIFSVGWLLWIPLTFLVKLAVNFAKKNLKNTYLLVLCHIALAFFFTAIHVGINYLIIQFLHKSFFSYKDLKPYIPSFFIFSLHIHFIIYFLIVAAYQGINYIAKFRDEQMQNISLKAELINSQNLALKMQIHPHFLFNTHHSIISLMAQDKNDEAIQMLTKLSLLLRKTLDLPQKEMVTLNEEIAMVRMYLEIQLIRFGDRLSVIYNIDNASVTCKVPIFILQPIVENALKHGIEPISSAGRIKISTFVIKNRLKIIISDNGRGVQEGKLVSGIGTKNIIKRLENQFADNFSFFVCPGDPAGTDIEIEIPATY